jgi:hypothetical protein
MQSLQILMWWWLSVAEQEHFRNGICMDFQTYANAYNVEGWSGKLAGTRLDDRKRVEWEGDIIFKVNNEEEVISIINAHYHHYQNRYKGLYSAMLENKYSL